MPFQYDVFISFARLDNHASTGHAPGWVDQFHESLRAMLSARVGREVRIWRDFDLAFDRLDRQGTVQALSNAGIFVAVLSPTYLYSEGGTREMGEFCHAAERNGGVIVDGFSRVLKVLKLPLDNEEMFPRWLKETTGFSFYEYDAGLTPIEFDPASNPDHARKFNATMARLAHVISEILRRLARLETRVEPAPGVPSPALPVPESRLSEATPGSAKAGARRNGVFVSYAREDQVFALELARKIKNSGTSVWVDQWDISEGDDWDRTIDDALYSHDGFLIVLSPAAVQSDEVRAELRAALNGKKQLFVVLHKECPRPPRALLNRQWTDLTVTGLAQENAVRRLIAQIREKLSQNLVP